MEWWLVAILALLAFVAVAMIVKATRMPRARGAMFDVWLRLARWMMAALLAASGIWVALSPRADQPLLDALERAFPAIRSAYMDGEAQREPGSSVRQATLRAREKNRWAIGGVMVLLALSLVVSLPSRRTTPRNLGG